MLKLYDKVFWFWRYKTHKMGFKSWIHGALLINHYCVDFSVLCHAVPALVRQSHIYIKFISLMYIIAKIYDRMQWNVTNLCRWTPFLLSLKACNNANLFQLKCDISSWDAKKKITWRRRCAELILWIGYNKMWINQSLKEMIKEVSDTCARRENFYWEKCFLRRFSKMLENILLKFLNSILRNQEDKD